MSTAEQPIKVLVAKPGLDGHDVGAKVMCRALMDAGMDVTYTGLRKSPEEIADAAAELDVDVVGLSILSGAHLPLSKKVVERLRERTDKDFVLIAGGNIPARDHGAMEALGFARVFNTGTAMADVVSFLRKRVTR